MGKNQRCEQKPVYNIMQKPTQALCIDEILFCLMYFTLHWQFHAKLQNNSINTETFNTRLGGRNLSSFRQTMLVSMRALATVNCEI